MGHKHEIQNQTLKRLAERVLDGDVVFFVGAGFSIDSEGNSTHRMMRRLVLRLLAMAAETEARGITTGRELLGDFVRKFHLDPGNLLARAKDPMKARLRWLTVKGLGKRGASQAIDSDEALENDAFEIAPYFSRACTDPKEVALIQQLMRSLGEWPLQRLGSEYYEVNDWFCRAFERLLHLGAMDENSLRGIGIREEEYRQEMNAFLTALGDQPDPAPFTPIRRWLLPGSGSKGGGLDRRVAGKILFLETLGFSDRRVMGGEPAASELATVARSYHERLLSRHHVLARFAREGWCPTVITTNFDLLIEGAYRLAGFSRGEESAHSMPEQVTQELGHDARRQREEKRLDPEFPQTLVSGFDVVASAGEFLKKAKAFRTAVVVKIHGCAARYTRLLQTFEHAWESQRENVTAAGSDLQFSCQAELEDCVRSLVFTYREIQHWRGDTWAADYLRTILRTRTVVFCGYSVRDPVIHDTFRGAFEEMARINRFESAERASEPKPELAPLYFMGTEGDCAFHSEAVLEAATEAVGEKNLALAEHPNRISFAYRGGKFPDLDDVFRWLQHLIWRNRQTESVRGHLARVSALLALQARNKRRPRTELDLITKRFEDLAQLETSLEGESPYGNFGISVSSRRARALFAKHVAWTERFHVSLLREFACVEDVRRLRMPHLQVAAMRHHQWYFPAMENPGWTCWAVVVELALRSVGEMLNCDVKAAECARPTVFFCPREASERFSPPWALTIQFAGAERVAAPPQILGAPERRIIWELEATDVPWPVSEVQQDSRSEGSFATRSLENRANDDGIIKMRAPSAALLWDWAVRSVDRILDDKTRLELTTFVGARWIAAKESESPMP